MEVALNGSCPGATTAGIILLTKARQLGLRVAVEVVGNPDEAVRVPGPALLYAPVLASCGVGREEGHGALVVLPGPPGVPLRMTATPHGIDGWFEVTRTGQGCHPATKAFVRLSSDVRHPARALAKQVRMAMIVLGLSPEPAVLDILFGAKVPPLTRLSIALRSGRALSGGRGEPITRYLSGRTPTDRDPLPADYDKDRFLEMLRADDLRWIAEGLSTVLADLAEDWIATAKLLAKEDDGRDLEFVYRLAEISSHLVQLPPHSILPPLGAAEDSISVGIRQALTADGEGDASQQLIQTFRFLGGRFVGDASYAFEICSAPPPPDEDEVGRWKWFAGEVREGRRQAESLWPYLMDPPH